MRWTSAFILAGLLAATAHAGTPLPDGPHIVVTGTGKASAKPDSVRVKIDFARRASTAAPARQGVDTAVDRYLAALPALGVDEDQVQASKLSVDEDTDTSSSGRRVSNGFVAERDVTAVLSRIDQLNALLDAALAAGGTINDVTFKSSHVQALEQQARQAAAADARSRASETAAAFGARAGAVYSIDSINDSRYDGYGPNALDKVMVTGSRVRAPVYLQPTIETSASVRVVFELQR